MQALDSLIIPAKDPVMSAMPAMIDDFAQLAGVDIRVLSGLEEAETTKAVRLLKGRNCLAIRGLGILCCAGNESDCSALADLAEKNCLAFLQGQGQVKPLSLVDRLLMRAVYLHKYSKKK
jgi:hypothetical protein